MSNYKIRVNSEAESKEAQELFFELGYAKGACSAGNYPALIIATPESLFHKTPYSSRATRLKHKAHNQYKEITLPQLRDLVVLKRNDVGDATHEDYLGLKHLLLMHTRHVWGGEKWLISTADFSKLKPIEKKEMKEYLDKQQDGTYKLIKASSGCIDRDWIEIPEGADIYAISKNWKDNIFFARTGGDTLETFNIINKNDWHRESTLTLENLENNYSILWQRHTHPEELPFIDDEPSQSLNDQYAEIETVRQSHRTASEIADSALKHIRERAETYDQPTGERSAAKTAKAFNAITGKDITESEVWLLLQLLKDVRQWSREDYHQDSAEDCIAYAALKAESLEGGE